MSRSFPFAPGEYYHIYQRGVDKRNIFMDDADKERFMKLLYLCNGTQSVHLSDISTQNVFTLDREDSLADVGAYCLMDNHFHILLHEKDDGGISRYLHKLSTGFTMYFNRRYERSGALFEGRFKAKHLSSDTYLKYIFAYIHLNPVELYIPQWKEKGIKDIQEARRFLQQYAYSSYIDYAQEKPRDEMAILNKEAFPEYFVSRQDFEREIIEWLDFNPEVQPRG